MKSLTTFILLLFGLAAGAVGQPEAPRDYNRLMNLSTDQLVELGDDYTNRLEKPDSALICLTIAQKRLSDAVSPQDRRNAAKVYVNLWYLYFFHYFDHSKAFDNIEHAREILESLGDEGRIGLPVLYLNYGCMYETLAEQSREDSLNLKAMEYFRKSYRVARQNNNIPVLSMAFSNMIYVSHVQNSLSEVEDEYRDFCQATDTLNDLLTVEYNLQFYQGLKLVDNGQWREALDVFTNQLTGYSEEDKQYLRYHIMRSNNIALCYAKAGDYRKAMETLSHSEQLATKDGLLDAKLEVYRFMTEYAHEAGNSEVENRYRSSYLSLKDSLINYHQLQSINQLQLMRDLKAIDQRMEEMKQRSHRERQIVIMVTIVAVIILLFLLWMYRQNRVLRAANRQLYEKSLSLLEKGDRERNRRNEKREEPASSPSEEDNRVLQKIIEVMENNPEIFEPDFTIERLAQIIDEKYRTVSRIINETGVENSSQFINRYRIDEACRRINDVKQYGHLSLEAIANSVGFRSRSSFGVAFKRATGLTPSEYQKMARSQ